MGRRRQDHYARRAQKEGHAARSVYKLEELDQRWKLLKPGDFALDLGCSPGSWMQYAAGRVGKSGRVIGYDLKAVDADLPSNAEARIGDVFELDPQALGGPFNVVLSDMAPATMGDRRTDSLRSATLVESALDVAAVVLASGGHVVAKLLEGSEVENIVRRMRSEYRKVERLRPKATRKSSTEIFLVGLHRLRGSSA